MNNANLKKMLFLPLWAVIIISLLSYTLLILIFTFEFIPPAFVYPVYLLSAYSLVIDILSIKRFDKKVKSIILYIRTHSRIIKLIESTKIGSKFLNDIFFRSEISIYQGFTMNILYTVFRVISSITYASVWFVSMAVYYCFLALLRFYLIYSNHKKSALGGLGYEYNCCKNIGKMLIFLNIPMIAMVILMVVGNSGYEYSGTIIYLSALYTFYMVILSIKNLVKFKKLGSPILSAAKVINFISAAMSLLGLQTAMITQFGGNDEHFRKCMNAVTGIAVCVIVAVTSIYMVINAKKHTQGELL